MPEIRTPDPAVRHRSLQAAQRGADPGGPLLVSGGGATYVATDALRAYIEKLQVSADALAAAHHDAHLLVATLRAVGPKSPLAPLPPAVMAALPTAEHLQNALTTALHGVRDHRRKVIDTATAYTQAERGVVDVARTLSGAAAVLVGRGIMPLAVTGLLLDPLLPLQVMAAVATWKALPGTDSEKAAMVQKWIREHPSLLSSAPVAEFARQGVENLDNVVLGGLGVPPGLAALLGDHHNGISGPVSSGVLLLTLASPLGILRDSKLRVRKVMERPLGSPAQGVAARLERVPGDDQVRIEKYTAPGAPPRYVVYVAPTGTFSPQPTSEPWDLQSNVAGVSRLDAASFRATEAAMRDAGIATSDQVQFVGFSQGGLVAGMLASSGHWNVQGLETTGAPVATLGVPGDVAGVDIRNREDFIPALAGYAPPTDRLQVERTAFASAPPPTDMVVPAHQKATYLHTARAVDEATSAAVRGQVATLDAFTADYVAREGSEMTVLTYHADRVWKH